MNATLKHSSLSATVLALSVTIGSAQIQMQGPTVLPMGVAAHVVRAADLDGDGDLDLVASDWSIAPGVVFVCLNQGNGSFAAPVTYASHNGTTSLGTFGLALGDFDGDGDLDLAVSHWTIAAPSVLSILANNGSASFIVAAQYNLQPNPYYMAVADLNGDYYPDLVIANVGQFTIPNPPGSVSIHMNRGNGTLAFAPPTFIPIGVNPISVAPGDFDGDGDMDLAVSDWNGTIVLLTNNGSGTFTQGATIPVGPPQTGYIIIAADLDQDGRLDLAMITSTTNLVNVLLNRGAGMFASPVSYPTLGNQCSGLVAADLDGDGYPELVATEIYSHTITVLRNLGTGIFAAPGPKLTTFGECWFVDSGDLDGDGRMDLIGGCRSTMGVSVFLNRTPGPGMAPFGLGCFGTHGTPSLSEGVPPRLGRAFQAQMSGLPPGQIALMFLGVSSQSWFGIPLPIALSASGLNGCKLFISQDVSIVFATGSGSTTFTLSTPPDTALIGAQFLHQALLLDPGANAAGLILTNPARAIIG